MINGVHMFELTPSDDKTKSIYPEGGYLRTAEGLIASQSITFFKRILISPLG